MDDLSAHGGCSNQENSKEEAHCNQSTALGLQHQCPKLPRTEQCTSGNSVYASLPPSTLASGQHHGRHKPSTVLLDLELCMGGKTHKKAMGRSWTEIPKGRKPLTTALAIDCNSFKTVFIVTLQFRVMSRWLQHPKTVPSASTMIKS